MSALVFLGFAFYRLANTLRVSAVGDKHSQSTLDRVGFNEAKADSRARWLAAALFAITVGLYAPAIRYDFVDYDDWMYVFKNLAVLKGLSFEGLQYAFTSIDGGSWMPLTWLSLQLDISLFGDRAGGLHLTNILLHALTSGFLLIALHRLTGNPGLSFLAATIFALHPLRTESVAWISERKDVLSGLFFALALLAYARYAREPRTPRLLVVIACLVAGLMAKPMLVTLPFLFLLLDFWPLRRMGRTWSEARTRIRPLVKEKGAMFALIIASCVLTYWSQKRVGAVNQWSPDRWNQALDIAGNYCFYLVKLAVPLDRTVIYPEQQLPNSVLLLLAFGLIAFTGVLIWKAFQWPWLAMGWFWFLGMLVPVIGILPVGMTQVADRYTYLPSIGIAIAIVWSIAFVVRKQQSAQRLAVGLAAVLLIVLGGMTIRDLPRWRSSLELFESALQVAPHKIAYNNLAYYCLRQEKFDRAIDLSTRAIELDPEYGASYSSRSMAYACKDDYARAKADYDRGVSLGDRPLRSLPNYSPEAITGSDPESHWEQFTTAIVLEPRTARDFLIRAESRVRFGATKPAIADFTKAIELQADLVAAYEGRASAFNLLGDIDAAIRDASQAIGLNTNQAGAYLTRAVAYTRLGNLPAALADNTRSIQLSPTNAQAYQNRAVTLFLIKDYDLAWKDVERSRELGGKPHDSFMRALSEASGRKP